MNKKLKNRTILNKEFKTKLIFHGYVLGVLIVGYVSGYNSGKNNNSLKINQENIVNEYLEEYTQKQDELEKEITSLQEQKEALQNTKTFNVKDLIVIEYTNENNETIPYILYSNATDGIYTEYHDAFNAWYNMHNYTEEHIYDFCPDYIHFGEYNQLFEYLTEDEITTLSNKNGRITNLELDELLNRIRNEYQAEENKSEGTLSLK